MSVLGCRGDNEARCCSWVNLCKVLANGHPLTFPLRAEARRPPTRLLVVVIGRGDARRTCIRTVALRGTQSCLQTEHRGEPRAVDSVCFKFLLSSSLASSLASSSFGATSSSSSLRFRFDRCHFRPVMMVSSEQRGQLPWGPDGLHGGSRRRCKQPSDHTYEQAKEQAKEHAKERACVVSVRLSKPSRGVVAGVCRDGDARVDEGGPLGRIVAHVSGWDGDIQGDDRPERGCLVYFLAPLPLTIYTHNSVGALRVRRTYELRGTTHKLTVVGPAVALLISPSGTSE